MLYHLKVPIVPLLSLVPLAYCHQALIHFFIISNLFVDWNSVLNMFEILKNWSLVKNNENHCFKLSLHEKHSWITGAFVCRLCDIILHKYFNQFFTLSDLIWWINRHDRNHVKNFYFHSVTVMVVSFPVHKIN